MGHTAVPFLQPAVGGRQTVMAGVKKIVEHPKQIEIDEMRPVAEQERTATQHLFKRQQPPRQFRNQLLLVPTPLVDASAPKLPFLEAQKFELIRGGNILLKINIIQLERH